MSCHSRGVLAGRGKRTALREAWQVDGRSGELGVGKDEEDGARAGLGEERIKRGEPINGSAIRGHLPY